jgi:hypothetical protein
MTIIQALKAEVGLDVVPADVYSKALVDNDLEAAIDYVKDDHKAKVDAAAVQVLDSVLIGSMTEGGYGVTLNRSAIEAKISKLKGGTAGMAIIDASNLWK